MLSSRSELGETPGLVLIPVASILLRRRLITFAVLVHFRGYIASGLGLKIHLFFLGMISRNIKWLIYSHKILIIRVIRPIFYP